MISVFKQFKNLSKAVTCNMCGKAARRKNVRGTNCWKSKPCVSHPFPASHCPQVLLSLVMRTPTVSPKGDPSPDFQVFASFFSFMF